MCRGRGGLVPPQHKVGRLNEKKEKEEVCDKYQRLLCVKENISRRDPNKGKLELKLDTFKVSRNYTFLLMLLLFRKV